MVRGGVENCYIELYFGRYRVYVFKMGWGGGYVVVRWLELVEGFLSVRGLFVLSDVCVGVG